VAYRCAITIETSVGRELPSKPLLVRAASGFITFERITARYFRNTRVFNMYERPIPKM